MQVISTSSSMSWAMTVLPPRSGSGESHNGGAGIWFRKKLTRAGRAVVPPEPAGRGSGEGGSLLPLLGHLRDSREAVERHPLHREGWRDQWGTSASPLR